MSDFATEGRWLWASDGLEVTWKNWVTWPGSAQESTNCAVMSGERVGNDGDEFAGRKGWLNVGCGTKKIKSLICQRGKSQNSSLSQNVPNLN